MSSTDHADLKDILEFVAQAEGTFPQDLCEVRESPLGGVGVFAKSAIPEGTTLLQLPKSAVFSASNSSIANLLHDAQIDGVLALNIAFIYETTVFRKTSHWTPYLKSITAGALPPAYWNDSDKLLLQGTTLDTLFDALTPQEEVQSGFEIAIDLSETWNKEFGLAIPQGYLDIDINDMDDVRRKFHKFVSVAYALSARVFEIDAFHESALVPIADLFNHHVVRPDLHFVSQYDVCDLCGEAGMCKHMLAEEIEAARDEEELRERSRSPKVEKNRSDKADLAISPSVISLLEKDLAEELDEQIREQSTDKPKELDPEECVDMTLSRDVEAGEEIFNSYGELSNVFLLTRYGFTIERNPYDIVHLGAQAKEHIANNEALVERAEWWANTGFELFANWFKVAFPEEEHEHTEDCDHDHDEEHEHTEDCDHDHEEDEEDQDEDQDEEQDEENDEEQDSEMEDDDEEEQEAEEPWLSELEVDYTGQATPALIALCTLLSMKEEDVQALIKGAEQEPDSFEQLISEENMATSGAVVRDIALAYKEKLDKAASHSASEISAEQAECAKNLVLAESAILEKLLESLQL